MAAAMASNAPADADVPPSQNSATTVGEFPHAGPAETAPTAGPAIEFENVGENNSPRAAASIAAPSPAFSASGSNLAPDPLADSAEVVWYVRPPTGGQFGPATPEVIRGWLAEGRISSDTLVWREGWRDWLEAGGVFPQLNLAVINPLAALNIPAPSPIVPQRSATPSPAAARPAPNGMVWLIAALGAITLLVIAVAVWFWLK